MTMVSGQDNGGHGGGSAPLAPALCRNKLQACSLFFGVEITMTTIQDVELKIKAVEFALGTFADYENDEEARMTCLRSHFSSFPHLKTCLSYSVTALINLLQQLHGELRQLRQLQIQQLELQLQSQQLQPLHQI
jgi:hypothetical protein